MQNRKSLCLLISLALLSTCLLFSCGEAASSDAESSDRPNLSSVSETSDRETQSPEESSIEESPEADYQVQMTEEMANAFLQLTGENRTVQELMNEQPRSQEWFESTYIAYGRLDEYILCNMPSLLANMVMWSAAAGEYLFTSSCMFSPSHIGLYLYKDGDFIPFENA